MRALKFKFFPVWQIRDGRCACPRGDACSSPGKHPITADGFKSATDDEAQLDAWEAQYPGCNWAIATGAVSGIFVVDQDIKPGKNGVALWAALEAEHGQAPETRTVRTGGGGTQLYFKHPGFHVGLSQNKLGNLKTPGIDVRGDGGYVVCPVSNHISGGSYELTRDIPCAAASPWLLSLIQSSSSVQDADIGVQLKTDRGYFPTASPAVLQAAADALDQHGPAIEGEGGDAHTFRVAAILIHDFALTDEEAWPLLQEWNTTCRPPWSDRDLRAKLRGGGKYGTAAYGCKRAMDALQTGRKLIEDWRAAGETEDAMFTLIARSRTLPFDDPAKRSVFEVELVAATGRNKTALALPKVQAKALARTLTPDEYDFDRSASGTPHDTLNNAVKVLEKQHAKIWLDEFLQRVQTDEGAPEHEWSDADDLALTLRLQREVGLQKIQPKIVAQAVSAYAQLNRRNCVRETLEALVWDQQPRIEGFLTSAYGTPDSEYTRAASKNFWRSIAARALKPGCKVDTMIVLEGGQGLKKSTSLQVIAGGPRLFTEASESPHNKDFFVTLIGKLIVEIAEMDSFSKGDVTAVKRVLSCASDRFRAPFERTARDWPRQGVFVGTTNRDDWARDETGARRFWPVVCSFVDLPYIEANREQLFAEAVADVLAGKSWWEMPREATEAEQEARRQTDSWEETIADYLGSADEATVVDVLEKALFLPPAQHDRAAQMRVASALKLAGFAKVDGWRDGRKRKWWKRAEAAW